MLFWYTRMQIIGGSEEQPEWAEMKDCFSVEKVLRCHELEPGRLTILLDDVHERIQKTEVAKGKTREIRNERETVQSEITLNKEDMDRFYELTNKLWKLQ